MDSGDHRRRMDQGRGPRRPGPVCVPNTPVLELKGRCVTCCLKPSGHTRWYGARMELSAVPAHMASADHQERFGDGRFDAYLALHGQGPHVAVVGDAW